ncbi:hypothetical protein [Desulfosoma caldarium]|uniref:Uncharacterized protein n=1 Tax=Desulfosoma caldarium TaxID=610254 RepID=A0A3N1VF43_9BACT|nr:hypothetical protein [Desulfosoma caldarium]ROR01505.1 hypothetical protein EDC27_0679 [Desulfosoma caldarium]
MTNPKKQDDTKVRRGDAPDEIGDLFKEFDGMDPSSGDEDDEILELDEVVGEEENGLTDLPDLDDGLSDLDDLEVGLDEPEVEEPLLDEEEVTVELAPSRQGADIPREPLDEELFDEELSEPQETLERKPEPLLAEDREGEKALRDEDLVADLAEQEELLEEVEEAEAPKPVETELWDSDEELDAMIKDAAVREETLQEFEPIEKEVLAAAPKEERVDVDVAAESLADKGFEGEVAVPKEAVDLASNAVDRPPLTFTEPAEEKAMEERPAMFQPMVEVLEKRLQIMVQKAVQEQLPIVVRRVLQEEMERLIKTLG